MSMHKRFFKIIALTAALCMMNLAAQTSGAGLVTFDSAAINEDNSVLFLTKTESEMGGSYTTLFVKRSDTAAAEQLTFYPEYLHLFSNGTMLQLTNKMGSVMLDITNRPPQQRTAFSLFDTEVLQRNSASMQISPDSKYVIYVEPTGFVFGDLILMDMETGRKFLITHRALQHLQQVSWSPDAESFVYQHEDSIYFTRPAWLVPISDSKEQKNKNIFTATKIADTSVKAVQWAADSQDFYVIEKNKYYKIDTHKILAATIYDSIVQFKQPLFTLPIFFDSNRDTVFFSDNKQGALVIKNRMHCYFFNLRTDTEKSDYSIPYMLLPNAMENITVVWKKNSPIIYFTLRQNGILSTELRQIENNQFVPIRDTLLKNVVSFSPDAKFALIRDETTYSIKNMYTHETAVTLDAKHIISNVWVNNKTVIVGTESDLVQIDAEKNAIKNLLVSQVADFGWDQNGTTILAQKNDGTRNIIQHTGGLYWQASSVQKLNKKKTTNQNYRLFMAAGAIPFANMIYLRSVKDLGTKAVIENAELTEELSKTLPAHAKKIALVFDLMDGTDGLERVLFSLNSHEYTATFFLTASVIQNEPQKIKQISDAGHLCAPLFTGTVNLSNSKYTVTQDFIKAGLAHTEDVFFQATGSELALFWHTPYYVSSPEIEAVAAAAGYTYIVPSIIVNDWVDPNNKDVIPQLPKNSYEQIEYIMQRAHEGAIIPIQLGHTENKTDYLYDKIELLLDLFAENGFLVVSLNNL